MIRLLLRTLTRPFGFLLARCADAVVALFLRGRGVVVVDVGGARGLSATTDLGMLEGLLTAPRVRGVLLRMDRLGWGWAELEEWRALVERVEESGRFVLATSEQLGNREMYLGSAATHLWMPPLGEVGVVGPAVQLRFLGDWLERLGISVEVESVGAYKSAAEPMYRSHASPENREAIGAVVEHIHEVILDAVARGRSLDRSEVAAQIARAPLSGTEALEAGFVDGLGYVGEIDELLEDLLGGSACRLPVRLGLSLHRRAHQLDGFLSEEPTIAVVHLKGTVVQGGDGRASKSRIESAVVVPVLRGLAKNKAVDAVVLHVDSPGGSALASDLIWREVDLLKREKPVVASLGNVAASGGYYIAAAASEIVASSTTITGSIGVIGARIPLSGALARLGIHGELIAGGPAGVWMSSEPLPPAQRERLRARLVEVYDTFVQRVVSGRRRPAAVVEEAAQGRAWTGRAAASNGLVDAIGGLDVAIVRARSLAGMRPLQLHRRVDFTPRGKRSLGARLIEKQRGSIGWGPSALPLSGLRLLLTHPWEALLWVGFDLDLR